MSTSNNRKYSPVAPVTEKDKEVRKPTTTNLRAILILLRRAAFELPLFDEYLTSLIEELNRPDFKLIFPLSSWGRQKAHVHTWHKMPQGIDKRVIAMIIPIRPKPPEYVEISVSVPLKFYKRWANELRCGVTEAKRIEKEDIRDLFIQRIHDIILASHIAAPGAVHCADTLILEDRKVVGNIGIVYPTFRSAVEEAVKRGWPPIRNCSFSRVWGWLLKRKDFWEIVALLGPDNS